MNSRLTAQELVARELREQQMVPAPTDFSGSIDDLATQYVLPNLIKPHIVESFHKQLLTYLNRPDPTFLIRALTKTTHGEIHRTTEGFRFKATDNAPAWWVHFALFQEIEFPQDAFSSVVETIPTHLFEISAQVPKSINAAGWHVAHIFAVKDRDTDYEAWRRRDLVGRCVRNIHPCNYFFLPKTDWRLWGGNERVISYFAGLYENYYRSVWGEFLSLAGADSGKLARVSGTTAYVIGSKTPIGRTTGQETAAPESPREKARGIAEVTYKSTRLAFKADLIEPLDASARFRIITPNGTFEMTKGDFYFAFPNVVVSKSYRDQRLYHFPSVPKAAFRFRITE